MWTFETEPDYQAKLDWAKKFVQDEVEPLDHVLDSPYDVANPRNIALVRPLQRQVREQGLWACHLGPELGGLGYGQVKLALLNEVIGISRFGPTVFGCQAPDSGNGEVLAHYGTAEQKARYLRPLLDGEIVSAFSMTEPAGGSDPTQFTCGARREDGRWLLSGEKWFTSNAGYSTFLIVMAVTDPDNEDAHRRMSMFIVPTDAPGVEIVRQVGYPGEEGAARHSYMRYHDVVIPDDQMLGGPGDGFAVAQTRLGGGRIHHAMRTLSVARRAFDLMCERALSRYTQGSLLSAKQMTQEKIADSWIELEQFRLLVLQTAWKIDKYSDYRKVRRDIAMVKAQMPRVLHDIASRALMIHGSLGLSDELPISRMVLESFHVGLADGASEVHKITVGKQMLRQYSAYDGLFPPYHLHAVKQAAHDKFAAVLAAIDGG
jgi:acyl-CoA dehydrogenase